MREIKFRLVIVEKHPPHWEEKITFLHFTFEQLLRSSKYWPPHYYEDYDLHGGRFIKARDEYTGLLDKQGKEIYEGDIVQCHYFKNRGLATGKIQWSEDDASFEIEWVKGATYGGVDMLDLHSSLEIVGNIYESNPELLKEER